MTLIEATLNVNGLGQNPVIKNEAAYLRHVFNLIVMVPGTDPLNPSKGCNFNSYYYRLQDDNELKMLEQTIRDQIVDYLDYRNVTVNVKALKENGKVTLYCVASMSPLSSPLLISTNGQTARYRQLTNFSKEFVTMMK